LDYFREESAKGEDGWLLGSFFYLFISVYLIEGENSFFRKLREERKESEKDGDIFHFLVSQFRSDLFRFFNQFFFFVTNVLVRLGMYDMGLL